MAEVESDGQRDGGAAVAYGEVRGHLSVRGTAPTERRRARACAAISASITPSDRTRGLESERPPRRTSHEKGGDATAEYGPGRDRGL